MAAAWHCFLAPALAVLVVRCRLRLVLALLLVVTWLFFLALALLAMEEICRLQPVLDLLLAAL